MTSNNTNKKENKNYVINNVAEKTYKHGLLGRIIGVIAASFLVILLTIFATSSVVRKQNLFEIVLKGDKDALISLSNTIDFEEPTTVLKSYSLPAMDNISVNDIPLDITEFDGPHNGENYFAHTFYVKNTGKQVVNLDVNLNILEKFKNAEKAMWVRLYEENSFTTYAHAKDDGNPEYGTELFLNEKLVFSKQYLNIEPEVVKKFTIVIWLEGDDPDCTDFIQGGFVKFSMDLYASLVEPLN